MASREGRVVYIILNITILILSVILGVLLYELYYRLHPPEISTLRGENIGNPTFISDVIQLEVLNGCGAIGVANKFTYRLRRMGFDVIETGNFPKFDVPKTYVIVRTLNDKPAKKIIKSLGLTEDKIVYEPSVDYYVDVTLVIGLDYASIKL